MYRPSLTRGAFRLVATLTALVSLLAPMLVFAPAAHAAPVCASGAVTFTPVHSSRFYNDLPTLPSRYAGWQVTNASGAALPDLWVQVGGFSGPLQLGTNESAVKQVGALAAGESRMLYVYVTSTGVNAAGGSFTLDAYPTRPDLPGASALCTYTNTYVSVENAIAANPNQVTAVVTGPLPEGQLGGLVTMTVTGDTGSVGAGGLFDITPAAYANWPANKFQLVSSVAQVQGAGTFTDALLFTVPGGGGSRYDYTLVYQFVAVGTTQTPTAVSPIQNITSGGQIKHTSIDAAYQALPPIQPVINRMSVAASVVPSSLPAAGGPATFTATVANSGSAPSALSELVVTLPAGAAYVDGTATIGAVGVADPVQVGSALVFLGPIEVPGSGSVEVTYVLDVDGVAGPYTTSVQGYVGSDAIGTTETVGSPPAMATTTVAAPPVAPVTGDEAVQVQVGASTTLDLSSLVTHPDPTTLTYTLGAVGPGVDVVLDGTVATITGDAVGDATFSYTACHLTLCSTSTVEVDVTAPAPLVVASDDLSAEELDGSAGATSTGSVLVNDTLGGAPVDAGEVTLSVTDDGGIAGVTLTSDGRVVVPAGTTAGTYTLTYEACTVAAPVRCDSAEVTVTVVPGPIGAADDDFTAEQLDGTAGATSTASVLDNDTLPGPVTVTVEDDGGLDGVTLTPDGHIVVPSGTAPGTYTVVYQVCEVLNPTSCAEGAVVVSVGDGSVAPVAVDGATTLSAGTGDDVDLSSLVTHPAPTALTYTLVDAPAGLVVAVVGTVVSVSAPAALTVGDYPVDFEVCHLSSCATATVLVSVTAAVLDADNVDLSAEALDGSAGATSTGSVLVNDTLGGAPVDASEVTLSVTDDGGIAGVTLTSDGHVVVPAGTTAGTYTLTYEACTVAAPVRCDSAEVTVTVVPGPIGAADDDFTAEELDGTAGATSTASVLDNDTLPGPVTVTVADDGGLDGVTLTPDGHIVVPSGTAPGSYTVVYQVCEVLNPTSCAEGAVVVAVGDGSVAPVAEDGTTSAVPGATVAVDLSSLVTHPDRDALSYALSGTPLGIGVTVDGAVATVSVPVVLVDGSYPFEFQVCHLSSCATATVFVTVATPVLVVADLDLSAEELDGSAGATSTGSVLVNDTLGGAPVDASEVTLSVTDDGGIAGVALTTDGRVVVPAGTAAGTYTLTYEACTTAAPVRCDSAEVTVTVVGAAEQPENPEQPEQPENPEQPEQPEQPENPEQPGTPGRPDRTARPDAPAPTPGNAEAEDLRERAPRATSGLPRSNEAVRQVRRPADADLAYTGTGTTPLGLLGLLLLAVGVTLVRSRRRDS